MSKKNDSLGKLIESYKKELKTMIPDIMVILTNHGYDCKTNTKLTEIIVSDSKDDDKIRLLITTSLIVPASIIGYVLTVRHSNNKVYIRQRVK